MLDVNALTALTVELVVRTSVEVGLRRVAPASVIAEELPMLDPERIIGTVQGAVDVRIAHELHPPPGDRLVPEDEGVREALEAVPAVDELPVPDVPGVELGA